MPFAPQRTIPHVDSCGQPAKKQDQENEPARRDPLRQHLRARAAVAENDSDRAPGSRHMRLSVSPTPNSRCLPSVRERPPVAMALVAQAPVVRLGRYRKRLPGRQRTLAGAPAQRRLSWRLLDTVGISTRWLCAAMESRAGLGRPLRSQRGGLATDSEGMTWTMTIPNLTLA